LKNLQQNAFIAVELESSRGMVELHAWFAGVRELSELKSLQ
jgi:hypothetical protein